MESWVQKQFHRDVAFSITAGVYTFFDFLSSNRSAQRLEYLGRSIPKETLSQRGSNRQRSGDAAVR